MDDLTSQMSKEQVSEVLTASWLYNLATINLLVTVADRADLLDHVDSLMNVALGIYGEGQIALSEEGEAMLDALRSIFDTAIEREQQGESP